jgi:hypothetical protein
VRLGVSSLLLKGKMESTLFNPSIFLPYDILRFSWFPPYWCWHVFFIFCVPLKLLSLCLFDEILICCTTRNLAFSHGNLRWNKFSLRPNYTFRRHWDIFWFRMKHWDGFQTEHIIVVQCNFSLKLLSQIRVKFWDGFETPYIMLCICYCSLRSVPNLCENLRRLWDEII